jgi:hypothetical protein
LRGKHDVSSEFVFHNHRCGCIQKNLEKNKANILSSTIYIYEKNEALPGHKEGVAGLVHLCSLMRLCSHFWQETKKTEGDQATTEEIKSAPLIWAE